MERIRSDPSRSVTPGTPDQRFQPTVAMIAVGRPTFDLRSAAPMATRALADLRSLDPSIIGDDLIRTTVAEVESAVGSWPRTVRTVVVVLATFADSTLAAAAVPAAGESEELRVVLWSFPEPETGGRLRWNSICGAVLASFRLRANHRRIDGVHGRPGDAVTLNELAAALWLEALPVPARLCWPDEPTPSDRDEAKRVTDAMLGVRIGIVGEPPAGFEPCGVTSDPGQLGASFDHLDLGDFFSDLRTDDGPAGGGAGVSIRTSLDRLHDLDGRDCAAVDQSLRLHDGLRRIARERAWDALALRCWPECFTDWGGAACAPLAFLSDAGLPAACEADGYGALTCLLLGQVAGKPPFLADLVDIDTEDNTGVFWHCGMAPPSMADPDRPMLAIDHPNRGIPLALHFGLEPGPITIARISQSGSAMRLVIGTGDVVEGPPPFTGTSGRVRFRTPVEQAYRLIIDEGLEHHFVLVPGDHRGVLTAVAERWRIPVIRLVGR